MTVGPGRFVCTVGVLARTLQRVGQMPTIPVFSFDAPRGSKTPESAAKAFRAAWRSSGKHASRSKIEAVCKAHDCSVADVCASLAAFCFRDDGRPRDASRPSAFEVTYLSSFQGAGVLQSRVASILRSPIYLDRSYVATEVAPDGAETRLEAFDVLSTLRASGVRGASFRRASLSLSLSLARARATLLR